MLVENLNENQNRNPFKLFEMKRNVLLILWVNAQRNSPSPPDPAQYVLSQGVTLAILIGKRFDECAEN